MDVNDLDLTEVCADLSFDKLYVQNLKDDWKAIAEHYGVPISYQITREVIKNIAIEHQVTINILGESATEELNPMTASKVPATPKFFRAWTS